jgi:hypothetical protein
MFSDNNLHAIYDRMFLIKSLKISDAEGIFYAGFHYPAEFGFNSGAYLCEITIPPRGMGNPVFCSQNAPDRQSSPPFILVSKRVS